MTNRLIVCRACGGTNTVQAPSRMAPFVAHRMLDDSDLTESVECLDCGLLFAGVEPTLEQLGRYYTDYWLEGYISEREGFEPGLRIRHEKLLSPRNSAPQVEEFIRSIWAREPESVLDLGGGGGAETPYRGRSLVHVYDVGNAPMAEGAERVARPTARYELVVLAHVLEHVPDPRVLLEAAYDHVLGSGLIYLEVPREAVLYGSRPRLRELTHLRQAWHEHINFFDESSLEALVTSTGGLPVGVEIDEMIGGGQLVRMGVRPPS